MPSVSDWIAKINRAYKAGNLVEIGGKFSALNLARFSSGIVSLDCALGGGWPFSRIITVAGEYSTGKTIIALKALNEIENYDRKTRLHKDFVKEDFEPCRGLLLDIEGAFDIGWALKNGFNASHHVVARPDFAEQAIDIITSAIQDNVFDLIVIDSIAAMAPSVEITTSSEDWQIGLAARLLNKFFRRAVSSINGLSQDNVGGGPCILSLNQFRIRIGMPFGDPRVLPGGKGQEFASSIIIYTKSAKYDDTKDGEYSEVILGGAVAKNKTYVPKQNFKYKLYLTDTDDHKSGEVDNVDQLLEYGLKYNLLNKKGKSVIFGGQEYMSLEVLRSRLNGSDSLRKKLWRSVVHAVTG